MTDKVDITAPDLPKVAGESETTAPTLRPVKETVGALEPVIDRPANTLELEDDPQEDIITDRRRVPVKASPPPARAAAPVKAAEPVPARAEGQPRPTSQRKFLVKAPLRGDGFESGRSVESLPEADPVSSPEPTDLTWLINAALAVFGMLMLGVLVWLLW